MKLVAQNRRARFDYSIEDTVEAGIILTGSEVKSVREGNANLAGSYVSFFGGRPVLKNATIAPYRFARQDAFDLQRDRQLLLSKRDIARLEAAVAEKGVALIPLEMRAGKYVKVVLGLGRGRKTIDKRHRIKERETARRVREGRDI